MMLIKSFIIIFLLSFYVSLNGQEIVANSNSPLLHKKARVARLLKIFTINGDSEYYNLKEPRGFNIAKDGTVFIIDQSKAIYHFSSSGKYLGNLFKKGEGPNELVFIDNYFLGDNSVIQSFRDKILIKNFKGKYIKDFRIPLKGNLKLVGFNNSTYYITNSDNFSFKNLYDGKEVKDMSFTHYFYSWKYGDAKTKKSDIKYKELLRRKIYKVKGGAANIIPSPLYAFVLSKIKNGSIYFCNNFDYKINKIIIPELSVRQVFSRPYSNVKHFYSKSYIKRMRNMKIPIIKNEIKHFKAVLKLINQGNELWVITSTVEKGKGILIDVFSKDGKYIDKFYLPIPNLTSPHLPEFNIVDDKLIILEKSKDEEHQVSVYKILK